jgi:polyhydroxyalkanoate synthesis regulator phasin
MDDLFKKFINTGVGFLSQGNKAVQVAIEKLVKESKISEQEGKKIVDDLLKNSETKRADLEKQFKGLTADLKNRVGMRGESQTAGAAAPKAKAAAAPAAKAKLAAKKSAASPATEATGPTKKAADKVSAAATKAQRSATAKAGAPKKATVQSADDSGEALDTQ